MESRSYDWLKKLKQIHPDENGEYTCHIGNRKREISSKAS